MRSVNIIDAWRRGSQVPRCPRRRFAVHNREPSLEVELLNL